MSNLFVNILNKGKALLNVRLSFGGLLFATLFLFLVLPALNSFAQTTTVHPYYYNNGNTQTYTVLPGVCEIKIECWGGGGGGGSTTGNNQYCGGGGGGAYSSSTISVTADQVYNITVGGGGAAATIGGSSYVRLANTSTDLVNAGGGAAGTTNAGGAGGTVAAGTGNSGGDGAVGSRNNRYSGGGGGAAGSGGVGGNANGTNAGTGNSGITNNTGNGGAGRTDNGDGYDGSYYGGGGGGARRRNDDNNDYDGGSGAAGYVRITTYSYPLLAFADNVTTQTIYAKTKEAYYTFDNTNADVTGNSDNAILMNGATYSSTNHSGYSLSLDGTDDYADLPDGIANYDEITIATWVYWKGGIAWQRIFDFGMGTGAYMFLTPSNGSVMRFAITTGSGEQQISYSGALAQNSWQHIAITISGSTAVLYLNGTFAASNTNLSIKPSDLGNTTANYLGESQYVADPTFNGYIDDFQIYSNALTASEIYALANDQPETWLCSATPTPPETTGGCGTVTATCNTAFPLSGGNHTIEWTISDNITVLTRTMDVSVVHRDPFSVKVTPTLCSTHNGTATVVSSNGNLEGCSFLWSTGGTTSSVTNLSPGSGYYVDVTDLCGETTRDSFDVLRYIDYAYVSTKPVTSPCSAADGAASVQSLESLNGFTYSWRDAPDGGGTEIGTGTSITGKPIGDYSIIISDGSCNKTINFNIGYEYSECASGTVSSASTSPASITVYDAGSAAASVSSGTSNLNIDSDFDVAVGDLLLIIQMQGVEGLNTSNSSSYGSYSSAKAGYYEYAVVKEVISNGYSNTIVTLTMLKNTYINAEPTSSTSRMRYQIVKVPRYDDLTLSTDINVTPWDGEKGGVLAIDVAGTLDLNGKTISADGAGFRGGAGFNWEGTGCSNGESGGSDLGNINVIYDYYAESNESSSFGYKGEGIGGTPAKVYDGSNIVSTGTDYYNGGKARGAVANAGGGGNDGSTCNYQNSGGGGGANKNPGGKGGKTWGTEADIGGEGGYAFGEATTARLIMGGGGGAGTANNASTVLPNGGKGGGIIIIHANTIIGTGTITSNGIAGTGTTTGDGAGGGGAGGTILITALNGMSNIIAHADGGDGGTVTNQNAHGPGGGGSGGMIYGIDDMDDGSSANAGDRGVVNSDNFGSVDGDGGESIVVNEADYQSVTVVGRNCGATDTVPPVVTAPDLIYCTPQTIPSVYTKVSDFTAAGGSAVDPISGVACIKLLDTSESGSVTTRIYRVYDRAGNYTDFTQTITEMGNSTTPALRAE